MSGTGEVARQLVKRYMESVSPHVGRKQLAATSFHGQMLACKSIVQVYNTCPCNAVLVCVCMGMYDRPSMKYSYVESMGFDMRFIASKYLCWANHNKIHCRLVCS